MGRYYEIVGDITETPVQYVGVYVLRWGKEEQPEVGFFESPVGRHKERWRNIAYQLRRQRDQVLSECERLQRELHEAKDPIDNALDLASANLALWVTSPAGKAAVEAMSEIGQGEDS